MRVALFSPFDPAPGRLDPGNAHVGGVERVLAQVSRRMADRGHEVTLVCSTDGPSGRARESGMQVVRRHRRLTLLRAPMAGLARALPEDSDVVHVPATYPFTTPPVLRRAHRDGTPSVLDFHFEPAPGTPLGRAAASLYRRIGPRAYGLARAVVVRSYAYGRRAPSLANIPEHRWRIVPNGIDTDRFRPPADEPEGDHFLFVGRLVPYKGLHVAIEALARRRTDLPLLVVGDGPLRSELQAQARRLRVDVRFLGHVPDERLPQLYQRARATILPSVTRQEAFGIALLESMACGTPVVASDLPGVADVARLGGLVVEPGHVDAWAEALSRAARTDTLPRGRALAERVHRAYSWDAVTDQLLSVYHEVVHGAPPSPNASPGSEVAELAHRRRRPVL